MRFVGNLDNFKIQHTIYYPLCLQATGFEQPIAAILPVQALNSECLMNFNITRGQKTSLARINNLNSDVALLLCRFYECGEL